MRWFLTGAFLLTAALFGAYMFQAESGAERECPSTPLAEQLSASHKEDYQVVNLSAKQRPYDGTGDEEWDVNLTLLHKGEQISSQHEIAWPYGWYSGKQKVGKFEFSGDDPKFSCADVLAISNHWASKGMPNLRSVSFRTVSSSTCAGVITDAYDVTCFFFCNLCRDSKDVECVMNDCKKNA